MSAAVLTDEQALEHALSTYQLEPANVLLEGGQAPSSPRGWRLTLADRRGGQTRRIALTLAGEVVTRTACERVLRGYFAEAVS